MKIINMIKKLIAYLLVYVVTLVEIPVKSELMYVLERLNVGDTIESIIIGLFYFFSYGGFLCYAFPEFKRKIKSAVVRMVILSLTFGMLLSVYLVCFGFIASFFDPYTFVQILCMVVFLFLFYASYKFLFYRLFAGERCKFKRVKKDFFVTFVLSLFGVLLISSSIILIPDVVRGYFVRRGNRIDGDKKQVTSVEDKKESVDTVVKEEVGIVRKEEGAGLYKLKGITTEIKEEKIVEKEEKEVTKESELLCVSSGSCGENVSYKLTIDSTLKIFGQGPMCDYDYTNKSPFKEMEIHKVIIEKGVTTIGDMAFLGCRELKSLEIADSVVTIGEWSFGYCEKLKSLFIPKSVKLIKCRAFRCCNKLLVVEFAKKVKVIEGNAFDDEVVIKKSRS